MMHEFWLPVMPEKEKVSLVNERHNRSFWQLGHWRKETLPESADSEPETCPQTFEDQLWLRQNRDTSAENLMTGDVFFDLETDCWTCRQQSEVDQNRLLLELVDSDIVGVPSLHGLLQVFRKIAE